MSPVKKQPQKKWKKVSFYVFNVKLLSNTRSGDDAYTELFKELFSRRIKASVQHDKQVILRTQFSNLSEKRPYFYGKISKFTRIDGRDWINLDNLEVEEVEIPKNRFPNLKEIDYVFVPSAHRFAIVKSNEVSIPNVLSFLDAGLKSILSPDEQVQVFIEQSRDIFEEIIKAPAIEKLKIKITYTNDDILEGAEEYMDELLKGAGIASLNIEAKADYRNNISVNNEVIGGALMLAKSNGTVEAKIINEHDRPQTLKTEDHPEVFDSAYTDDKPASIAGEIIKLFRNG